MIRLTDRLNMTIVVDWDAKPQTIPKYFNVLCLATAYQVHNYLKPVNCLI